MIDWHGPWWLALASLPWIAWWWRSKNHETDRLTAYADIHLLPRLLMGTRRPRHQSLIFALAWTLAVVAVAGPYWKIAPAKPTAQLGTDIAVVVDISPSMAVADLNPNRLEYVKRELKDYTAPLRGDRLALIAFSANAYLTLPLSADQDAFNEFVSLLDPSLTSLPGTNLGRALEVAEQALADSVPHSRAIILLTDGGYHDRDVLSAARDLRRQDIPLYVIGVGTELGGPVPDLQGHFLRIEDKVVQSRLEPAPLIELAALANGRYFDIRDGARARLSLFTALRDHTRLVPHTSYTTVAGAELFLWPLASSLAIFLWLGIRRMEILAVLAVPLMLTPPPASAAAWSEQEAYQALQHGDYVIAYEYYAHLDSYRGWLGRGAAAYRLGRWATAQDAFRNAAQQAPDDILQAQALYNRGNALAQLHRYPEASALYRESLRLDPVLTQAAHNLSVVNALFDLRLAAPSGADHHRHSRVDGSANRISAAPPSAQAGQDARRLTLMPPAGMQSPQTVGASNRPSPLRQAGNAQRLKDTLALWQQQAHGSDSELASLQDHSAELLRYRFLRQDHGPNVKIILDQPW